MVGVERGVGEGGEKEKEKDECVRPMIT